MSVLSRVNFIAQQRLDLSHLLMAESFTAFDFRSLITMMTGSDAPYVVRGFEIVFTSSNIVEISANDSLVFNPQDGSGAFYRGVPGTPNIELALSLKQTFYVEAVFANSTENPVNTAFWNPLALNQDSAAGNEFTASTNSQNVLGIMIPTPSTTGFTPGAIPLYKITLDASQITEIVDCRPLLFRLGTGGAIPDPSHKFPWSPNRAEPVFQGNGYGQQSGSPFLNQDASGVLNDKGIKTLKGWMDAIMTRISEITGSPIWYGVDAKTNYVKNLNLNNVFFDSPGGHSLNPSLTTSLKWNTNNTLTSEGTTPIEWQANYAGIVWRLGGAFNNSALNHIYSDVKFTSPVPANGGNLYLVLRRDVAITLQDDPVNWNPSAVPNCYNGLNNFVVTGNAGDFTGLAIGDYVRKGSEGTSQYNRVVSFTKGDSGVEITTDQLLADNTVTAIRLSKEISETSTEVIRIFQANYTAANLVADTDSAAVAAGIFAYQDLNCYWIGRRVGNLFMLRDFGAMQHGQEVVVSGPQEFATGGEGGGSSGDLRIVHALGTSVQAGVYQNTAERDGSDSPDPINPTLPSDGVLYDLAASGTNNWTEPGSFQVGDQVVTTSTLPIKGVSMKLSSQGGGPGGLTGSIKYGIYPDNAGSPNFGSPVAETAYLNLSTLTTTPTYYELDFGSVVTLPAGTYWFIATDNNDYSSGNYFLAFVAVGDGTDTSLKSWDFGNNNGYQFAQKILSPLPAPAGVIADLGTPPDGDFNENLSLQTGDLVVLNDTIAIAGVDAMFAIGTGGGGKKGGGPAQPSGHVKVVIYPDVSGAPDLAHPAATSDLFETSVINSTPTYYSLNFTTPPVLAPGSYWFLVEQESDFLGAISFSSLGDGTDTSLKSWDFADSSGYQLTMRIRAPLTPRQLLTIHRRKRNNEVPTSTDNADALLTYTIDDHPVLTFASPGDVLWVKFSDLVGGPLVPGTVVNPSEDAVDEDTTVNVYQVLPQGQTPLRDFNNKDVVPVAWYDGSKLIFLDGSVLGSWGKLETNNEEFAHDIKVNNDVYLPARHYKSVPWIDHINRIWEDNANFFWDPVAHIHGVWNYRIGIDTLEAAVPRDQTWFSTLGDHTLTIGGGTMTLHLKGSLVVDGTSSSTNELNFVSEDKNIVLGLGTLANQSGGSGISIADGTLYASGANSYTGQTIVDVTYPSVHGYVLGNEITIATSEEIGGITAGDISQKYTVVATGSNPGDAQIITTGILRIWTNGTATSDGIVTFGGDKYLKSALTLAYFQIGDASGSVNGTTSWNFQVKSLAQNVSLTPVTGFDVVPTAKSAHFSTKRIPWATDDNQGPSGSDTTLDFTANLTWDNTTNTHTIAGKSLVTGQPSVTADWASFQSTPSFTGSGVYTYTHFEADPMTVAGTAPASVSGFSAGTLVSGTATNYGFYGNVATATNGATNWNLYMAGTAANFLNANLGIGQPTQSKITSRLTLGDLSDTSAAGGILFGQDTNLFRAGTQTLKTDSNLVVGQTLTLLPMHTGSILFVGSNGLVLEDNSMFFWDDTNHRLGIGTNSLAGTTLHGENHLPALYVHQTTDWTSALFETTTSDNFVLFNNPTQTTQISSWSSFGMRIGVRNKGTGLGNVYVTSGDDAVMAQFNANGNTGFGLTFNTDATFVPASTVSVDGGVTIGSGWSHANAAPSDGMIVKGQVGLGTATPAGNAKVHIQTDAAPGSSVPTHASYALLVSGTDGNNRIGVASGDYLLYYEVNSTYGSLSTYNYSSNQPSTLSLNGNGGNVVVGGITATAQLTVGSNTTTAAGGISFGNDTDLYRDAANSLKTDGAFSAASIAITGLTAGSVLFANSTHNISQDNAHFFWDATNQRLGIGTSTPASALVVGGNTTDAVHGMSFGTDTTLYRSATSTIKTDGTLTVGTALDTKTAAQFVNYGTVVPCGSYTVGANDYIIPVNTTIVPPSTIFSAPPNSPGPGALPPSDNGANPIGRWHPVIRFTAQASGRIATVTQSVQFITGGAATQWWIEIYSDNAGSRDTLLGSSDVFTAFPGSNTNPLAITYNFSANVTLTAGTVYWWRFNSNSAFFSGDPSVFYGSTSPGPGLLGAGQEDEFGAANGFQYPPSTTVSWATTIAASSSASPAIINLPAATSGQAGRVLVIKDVGGAASNANQYIKIVPNGSDTIDSSFTASSPYILDTSTGSITLYCTGAGSWIVT